MIRASVLALLLSVIVGFAAEAQQPSQSPDSLSSPAPQAAPGTADSPAAGQQTLADHGTMDNQGATNLRADIAEMTCDDAVIEGSTVQARNVVLKLGEYVLTGDRLEGDFDSELVFTGTPTLTYRSQTLRGDAIRFSPSRRTYRVENLHTGLTPEFMRNRLTSPLYLAGESVAGHTGDPIVTEDADATTCDKEHPDYLLRAREIEVDPGKRVVLRRATLYMWGHRLLTFPAIVVPLDRRPSSLRTSHLPAVGHSQEEGWFAKSAFSYEVGRRSPGTIRLDMMEKKGIGLGVEQEWADRRLAGAVALYAIPTGGSQKNLSGKLSNRLSLGAGQAVTLNGDLQQSSYLSLPGTQTANLRAGYERTDTLSSTAVNIARLSTNSGGYRTRNYTAGLSQTFRLSQSFGLSFGADYSRNGTLSPTSSGDIYQRTEQLTLRAQATQHTPDYALEVVANRNVPIGERTATSYFSGVEKLPEVSLTSLRFRHGFLSQIPATFLISAGKYAEGTNSGQTSTRVISERLVAGAEVSAQHIALSPSTDLNMSGSFQQFLYTEGAAQYVVRDKASLTQRWGANSGLNLDYTYQRPEGGTPFRFDQPGQYHTLTADLGMLNDRRLQLTLRTGYDFTQTGFGGYNQPWQTLSANLLYRPASWARLQHLLSFDPNNGHVQSVVSDIRLRGASDLAIDLVSKYDPQRHRVGQLNGYLNVPIDKRFRVVTLFQYNGYLDRFESRNLQLVWDLHCLEASLTYTENPYGFRNDRQLMFQLRIKAIPVSQRFGVGQFGQALDTGVGGGY